MDKKIASAGKYCTWWDYMGLPQGSSPSFLVRNQAIPGTVRGACHETGQAKFTLNTSV